MKKRVKVLLLAGMMACMAAGCGDNETSEPVFEDAVEETEDKDRAEAANRLEAVKKSGKLIIGISADYAPFEFTEKGTDGSTEYAGSDIELGKYIAEQLGVQADFVEMPFEDCFTAVKEGSVDLILLGMLPDQSRLAYVDFTDAYYQPGDQVLLIKKGQVCESLDDLEGKTVAAQYGSLQAQLVVEQLPESCLELTDTVSDGIAMLKNGTADAVAADKDAAETLLKEYSDLVLAEAAFVYEQEGVVGGVVEREPELLEKINEVIAQVNDRKLYLEWLETAMQQSIAQAKAQYPAAANAAGTTTPSVSPQGSDTASQAAGSE